MKFYNCNSRDGSEKAQDKVSNLIHQTSNENLTQPQIICIDSRTEFSSRQVSFIASEIEDVNKKTRKLPPRGNLRQEF